MEINFNLKTEFYHLSSPAKVERHAKEILKMVEITKVTTFIMKNNFGSHSWRAYLIYYFLFISLLILIFRIVSLQFIDGDFLKSKGKSMLETSRPIPAIRGSILDRNDFPLAISINQYDLYALKNFSKEDHKKLQCSLIIKKRFH